MTRTGDALLVTDLADRTLANTTAAEVDDDLLDAAWKLLGDLHDAGISHGSLDDIHIWVDASGGLQLMGFSDAVDQPDRRPDQPGRRCDAGAHHDRRGS